MGKGLFAAIIVIFAGFVGYKIVEKKNPQFIKKVKGSISDAGDRVSAVLSEARESFHEGYARG